MKWGERLVRKVAKGCLKLLLGGILFMAGYVFGLTEVGSLFNVASDSNSNSEANQLHANAETVEGADVQTSSVRTPSAEPTLLAYVRENLAFIDELEQKVVNELPESVQDIAEKMESGKALGQDVALILAIEALHLAEQSSTSDGYVQLNEELSNQNNAMSKRIQSAFSSLKNELIVDLDNHQYESSDVWDDIVFEHLTAIEQQIHTMQMELVAHQMYMVKSYLSTK